MDKKQCVFAKAMTTTEGVRVFVSFTREPMHPTELANVFIVIFLKEVPELKIRTYTCFYENVELNAWQWDARIVPT